MPFAHPGHQSDAYINKNEAIRGDITLLHVLRRYDFRFVVAAPDQVLDKYWRQELPAPFRYPYGEEHSWSEGRYNELLPKTKGHQFKPAWSFDNDNEHLAALTQYQVQDVMWIHKAAQEIGEMKFRACFINAQDCPPDGAKQFYVVVPLSNLFLANYEKAWRKLIKSEFLQLRLFDHEKDKTLGSWDARIHDATNDLAIIQQQQRVRDLVLLVRKPHNTELVRRPHYQAHIFEDRRAADIAFKNGKDQ